MSARLCGSVRLLVAILACFSLTVNFAQRMNLTVGILCMVNHTALSNHSNDTIYDGPFVWDRYVQGQVLAAYSYGYIILQAVGGILAYHVGPFEVNFVANIVSTVLTFLSPLIAGNYVVFCIFRALIGLFGGLTWASLFALMTNWAPITERTRLISISLTGIQIGSIITPPISGALCSLSSPHRWAYIYYVSGGMGALWCILWLLCVRSTPANHPFISKAEKYYLMTTIDLNRLAATDDHEKDTDSVKGIAKVWKATKNFFKSLKDIPFRSIFNSTSCRALFLTHFFNNFVFHVVVTNISTFIYDNLHTTLIINGLTSALPFLGFLIVTLVGAQICDLILQKTSISRNYVRKIFASLGSFGQAVFIFVLGFTDKSNTVWSITLFVLIMTFMGFNTGGGFFMTPNDIAPKYSGIIWGISNMIATIPAIIMPIIIGALTEETHTGGNDDSWKIVMMICGICNILTGVFYDLFVKIEMEPWAVVTEDETEMKEVDTEASESVTNDSVSSDSDSEV